MVRRHVLHLFYLLKLTNPEPRSSFSEITTGETVVMTTIPKKSTQAASTAGKMSIYLLQSLYKI